ncbi:MULTISPECIES: helix-turn-helix domain-containing protein [Flavobacterium]|uniref:helix-turn-helix domain-containing protein n=1 Tax=Flavobacterium TaxID=237 RepID=UPI001FCB563B|nr:MULTISPECIES: AraC family transcriptional regulator [Flavobacterium]UOK41905.1 AraC family transcriptional regulator [Flavobacterium enshiense]
MKSFTVLDIQQFESDKKRKEFYANTMEQHLISSHKNICKPHKHNFYLTVLFTHGSGIHEIDFVKYDVKPGSLFFMNPGQMHHWELSADIQGFIFFHTQSYYDIHYTRNRINNFPFFFSVKNSPLLYLQSSDTAFFKSLFEQIYSENQSDNLLKTNKIISLIDLIYIESTRHYIRKNEMEVIPKNPYTLKFQTFEALVEEHYKSEKSPSQYANRLNISAKHLNRITQNMVGKTTTDIILDRVFLEAKREMIAQKLSFNQIADLLGYEDYAYFSRLFRKKCGETPTSFIKKYR